MLSHLIVSLWGLAMLTSAAPQASRFRHAVQTLEKRQSATSPSPTMPFAVTGVITDSINPRLEIRQLAANTDQFNIFLLGLQALQQESEDYFLGYYQIAAIHGAPAVAWNGVQGIPAADHGQNYPGYCTHQSNIFLPWHRPYLALFEQMVVSNAQQIAASFPAGNLQDSYVTAASTLRIPYWDWAMDVGSGQDSLPDFVSSSSVTVITPNGTQTITNPLYSYNFQTAAGRQGLTWFPYVDWNQTLRWPTEFAADATTDSASLNRDLNSIQQNNKQRIYAMFTGNSNFTEVGTNPYISNSANSYDSFESVHDQVHVSVGGTNYGDMSIIAVSSYDPSFWLHHAMVDRVFALWQALYPDSYVEPARQWTPSFWYENGTILDADSGLAPFHSDPNGNFWTSNTARNVATFGYTYPELQSGNVSDVKAAINTLYGSGTAFNTRKSKRMTGSESNRVYRLIFQAPKGRLPSTYKLYFFLGNPISENPTEWYNDPNLLGSQAFLQGPVPGPSLAPVTVTGVAPLNDKLNQWVSEGRLASLAQDDVLNLLTGAMTFRVMMIDNTEAPLDLLPELKVGLASIEVIPPTSIDQFPTYVGDWEVHYSVTQGQQGGMNGPDDV